MIRFTTGKYHTKGKAEFPTVLIVCGFAVLMVWIFKPRIEVQYEQTPLVACGSNMKQLGIALTMYAWKNSNSYPNPEKWCDFTTPYLGDLADKTFRCPAVNEGKCHYAMNSDCEPNSSPDTVLLFETKGGWNLSGGPELLSTNNHGEAGSNILFNDGSVERIKKEEITNLNWE